MKWRNDFKREEEPGINSVVTTASDEVQEEGIFKLYVSHVKSSRGNGFMPSLGFPSGFRNGNVHLGEGEEAYNKAIQEGQEFLTTALAELDNGTTRYTSK